MAISKKFFVDIDLQGNGLNNSTVGANADMTKAGSFQYDSTANRLQYYNGATIETIANLNDLTGGLDFQGAYDAATNDPNLTTPAPGAIFKGYYWVVTVAGTFFGEPLAVGDSLFANVNDPASLADWTLVQGNVDLATTTTPGITYLATNEQVATGTETGAYAVNPASLQSKINAQTYGKKIDLVDWTGSSGNYSYTFASPLGTSFLTMSSLDSGTGEYVEVAYSISGSNVTVSLNNLPTDTLYVSLVKAYWAA